jgi:hypothetical protein
VRIRKHYSHYLLQHMRHFSSCQFHNKGNVLLVIVSEQTDTYGLNILNTGVAGSNPLPAIVLCPSSFMLYCVVQVEALRLAVPYSRDSNKFLLDQ